MPTVLFYGADGFFFVFSTACTTSSSTISKPESDRPAQTQDAPFHTEWDTTQPGGSDEYSIRLPLVEEGQYDFTADWGDGTEDHIIQWNQNEVSHRYEEPGTYHVRIEGTLDGWSFAEHIYAPTGELPRGRDQAKLLAIHHWGGIRPADGGSQFIGASNLIIPANDAPNLDGITRLDFAFAGCSSLQFAPGMIDWDVSSVTTMEGMFYDASHFNQPIDSWDVSSVREMRAMFAGASNFNQPLNSWDVSSVRDMSQIFVGVPAFDHCSDEPLRCFDE